MNEDTKFQFLRGKIRRGSTRNQYNYIKISVLSRDSESRPYLNLFKGHFYL